MLLAGTENTAIVLPIVFRIGFALMLLVSGALIIRQRIRTGRWFADTDAAPGPAAPRHTEASSGD